MSSWLRSLIYLISQLRPCNNSPLFLLIFILFMAKHISTSNAIATPTDTVYQPPMINGVSASKVFIPQQEKNQTTPTHLYDYLIAHFDHITAQEWQQRFHDRLILDASGQALNLDSPYLANQHIYYYRFLANEIHVPFQEQILFENDDLLVVDKPHFLTISPTGQYVQETLLVRLKKAKGYADLSPIHRLDRETAGVVLFSKRPHTRGIYQQLFAERQVQKTYHAIAAYRAALKFPCQVALCMEKGDPFYTMRVVEGPINSQTNIQLLQHDQKWALYELKPHTGKQHQLRLHLNWLNIPIQHDPFYPIVAHKAADDFSNPLQLLAKKIEFFDPVSKQAMQFSSEQCLTLP